MGKSHYIVLSHLCLIISHLHWCLAILLHQSLLRAEPFLSFFLEYLTLELGALAALHILSTLLVHNFELLDAWLLLVRVSFSPTC